MKTRVIPSNEVCPIEKGLYDNTEVGFSCTYLATYTQYTNLYSISRNYITSFKIIDKNSDNIFIRRSVIKPSNVQYKLLFSNIKKSKICS